MSVIAHKDVDDEDEDDVLDDHADCTLSLPPQLEHAPPAVQACVQSYHEQLASHQAQVASHLARMRSVQKRMLADIGRLAAEPVEFNGVSVEVLAPSNAQDAVALAQSPRSQQQRQPSSPRQGNLPLQFERQASSRAGTNLPSTVFSSSGDSGDLHTQNVLFSPGGGGRDATSARESMQSTPSKSAMPLSLDPAIESRLSSQDQRAAAPPVIRGNQDNGGSLSGGSRSWSASARGASADLSRRPTLDAATAALDSLTSQARVKRFLTRFKSRAMGDDDAQ